MEMVEPAFASHGGRARGEFAKRLAGADAHELAKLGYGTTDECRIDRGASLGGAWHPVWVDTMAEAYSGTSGIGGDPPPAGSAEEKSSVGLGSTQAREVKTMSCVPFSSPVKNSHWIQFLRSHRILGKNEIPGSFRSVTGQVFVPTVGRDPTPILDGTDNKKKLVYYDQLLDADRSRSSVTIFDQPDPEFLVGRTLDRGFVEFDTYLVCDGVITYRVHWEIETKIVDGRDVGVIVKIDGKPATQFHDKKLWEDELLLGYKNIKDGKLVDPVVLPNPIPKTSRNTWK
jgi:hypothetical protein